MGERDAAVREGAGGARALAAWLAALAVVVAGALRLGTVPALSTPPLARPGDLVAWASAREPVEAAFALLRVGLAAGAAYLLAVTVVSVLVRLLHAQRLGAAVDLVTVPAVRRLVGGALGLGLAGAGALGPVAPGPVAAVAAPPAATLALAASPGATPPQGADAAAPTMERIEEAPAGTSAPVTTQVTLVAGDHLWSTAERALATAWDRAPSDAEVAPFWRRLVAANLDRLPDPANPDLVLPGLTVVVPAPPPAP